MGCNRAFGWLGQNQRYYFFVYPREARACRMSENATFTRFLRITFMKRFENKVALVTGGAAGIGRATVERLVQEGASVMIADYNKDGACSLSSRLNSRGYDTEAAFYDARDLASGKEIVSDTLAWKSRIDVLVNNVGGSDLKRDRNLLDLDMDYVQEVFRLNLTSMMVTIRETLPDMMQRQQGSIVNVSSVSASFGDFRGTLYGMSKAGVNNLVRYVATQYGRYGIRCNGVAPWLVLTPAALKNIPESMQEVFLKYNTVPYLGRAEDVAASIAFLASDDARYISGQTLSVDGGMSCHNPTVADLQAL